ncbi:Potassium voltage-gated channel subfamily B member 2 [Durusdinium trenchii]|uniref:Potassium voltage-gated channel subfamily B member 2 n=1 Tax=Durusdinium trenchii TaxID=1381693 RepID=A0ABP0J947_9DINO
MEQQQQKEKRTSKEQSQQENSPLPAIPPATIAGYGVVGLTRGHRVRRRLQALKNSLAITLGRLAKDGTLVVLWPGLPLHPVLFFIAGSLRPLFQRVHVFSPEGSKTFEVYILAAGYKREKADSKVPGMGGLELRSFFEDTWRCDGLDDVLLWTLAPMAEDEETNVGITGKGLILGYTQLWKTWGTKLTSLALDLGMLLGQDDGMASPTSGKKSTRTKAARAKERAKNRDKKPPEAAPKLPKPKETDVTKKTAPKEQPAADEPDKVSEKPKAEAQEASEKPRADGAEEASEKPDEEAPEKPKDQEASGEPRDEASHSPKAPEAAKGAPEVTVKTAAAVSEQREEKQDEDTRQPDTKGERDRRPSDPDPKGSSRRSKPGGWARRQVPFGAKLHPVEDDAKPRRPRFVLKRAMPSLSCSLGASPGNKYLQPDYEELAEKHPLIHKALEVARHGKQKHWDLDNEESAGGRGSMTDGLRFSTLEDPSTAHASQVSSLETISPVEPNS